MKYLLRLWVDYPGFKEARECNGGKYVTIRITPSSDERVTEPSATIFNDGDCYIYCDEYEIIGSESGDKWNEFVRFNFDGTCLVIIPKVESYVIGFPTIINE